MTNDIPQLTHTRSCSALTPGEGPCTCGLEWRIQLQTEQTAFYQAEELLRQYEQEIADLRTSRDHIEKQLNKEISKARQLVNDYVEEIKTLNRSNAAQGWQPISTAPKDGAVVIGFDPTRDDDDGLPHGVDFMRWWNGCWIDPLTHSLQPTHWKLPDPPKERKPQDLVLEKVKEPEAQRVSKHSRIFVGADGNAFLGK